MTQTQPETAALPELTGTDKQIAWAINVRAAVLKKLASIEQTSRESVAGYESDGDTPPAGLVRRIAECEELRTKILTIKRWRLAKEFCDGAGATIAWFAAKSGCAWYTEAAWATTNSVRVLPPTA